MNNVEILGQLVGNDFIYARINFLGGVFNRLKETAEEEDREQRYIVIRGMRGDGKGARQR